MVTALCCRFGFHFCVGSTNRPNTSLPFWVLSTICSLYSHCWVSISCIHGQGGRGPIEDMLFILTNTWSQKSYVHTNYTDGHAPVVTPYISLFFVRSHGFKTATWQPCFDYYLLIFRGWCFNYIQFWFSHLCGLNCINTKQFTTFKSTIPKLIMDGLFFSLHCG